jgi:hypothetical protein
MLGFVPNILRKGNLQHEKITSNYVVIFWRSHFGICPTTQEPILMIFTPDKPQKKRK